MVREMKAAELVERRRQRELNRQEKYKIPGKVFVTRSRGLNTNGESSSGCDNVCCTCSGR